MRALALAYPAMRAQSTVENGLQFVMVPFQSTIALNTDRFKWLKQALNI